ncbi:MAG: rhodanese [Cyanobacteria bacterium SID2]|nr:rhodanese [Cyanobacteria bacterium SID2]MBP0005321.1 rhodanese [Cyanobacteria bacterium SBC]
MPPSISVEELAERLASQFGALQLIDVREPEEVEIVEIEGFTNLPMSQVNEWIPQILDRFDPDVETLVICHHGIRSAYVCQWLTMQGFTKIFNVAGGIDAYAIVVDRTLPRY